ncbi:helix-turn-helix domain-containing protein [Cryptobacterium curtum]|uniref:helix-turn-helix domain-containing protein n=1 Tax=Cryptobacterium curtum TaxID=84163 RepID=UPI0023574545|nr:helix-turn-helix domain-containing protein [Cryptobacterium curtum]
MKSTHDIASGYTASQAAKLLGVGRHEVARLVRNGILHARKTDFGALMIDPDSVHAHEALSQFKGRPWNPQTAWAALLAIGGNDISWLEYHKRRRLLLKLREIDATELVWLARNRMKAKRYLVSSSFEDDVRKALVATGMASTFANSLGLVSTVPTLDGYAVGMTAEELECNFFLVEDATGSCTARFASDLPDSLADATEMPAAVVACDLAMSVDVRERRCGLDYLGGLLDEMR